MFQYFGYDPQIEYEKRALRTSAGFVGALMLVLIVTMNLTYLVVAYALALFGFLPKDGLSQENLGLDNTTYLIVYGLVYAFAMGSPLLVRAFTKNRFVKYPPKDVPGGLVYFGTLAAMGVCMVANLVTNYLVSILESIGIPSPEFPQLLEPTNISFVLNLIIMAMLPALLEELVFRWCVLRALRPFGDGLAIVISAVLFGLMHGNIRQIPFALMVGLALGFLYVVTNCLWLPILVHFMNNALSVCLEYTAFSMNDYSAGWFYVYVIYGLAVLGVLTLPVLFLLYRKQMRISPISTRLSTGQRVGGLLKAPTLVISLLLFFVILIFGM